MVTWLNQLDDPELPAAQSFAVVGPVPERLRLAFERQEQTAEELPPADDDRADDPEGGCLAGLAARVVSGPENPGSGGSTPHG